MTDFERNFLEHLEEPPYVDVWLHSDADRTPWMIVSIDFIDGGSVADTLRLDVEPDGIKGGWSPCFLNGDSGVRAEDAEVDLASPDALVLIGQSEPDMATVAHGWFAEHVARWPTSARRKRWSQ
jgi:hypothetical protein